MKLLIQLGKIFIIAGSTGMTGAAVMAASAAMRSGAGLVTVGCPASVHDILETVDILVLCIIFYVYV